LYYRVVGVDFDGKLSYSEVKKLSTINYTPSTINIYPNPAKDEVHIECANAKQLLIIDYLGRTIKQFNNPPQHLTFNCKLLTKGVYLVQIITASGNMNNIKLLVE
jgi:hypothetical protein